MRLRPLMWSWVAAASVLVAGPAAAVSVSFADLTPDTVLSNDRLEFSNFETPGMEVGFDPEDWELTLLDGTDTLRIAHVGDPLDVGPLGLVRFELTYDVTALDSESLISGIDLLLDDATDTTDLGAVRIAKEISPVDGELEVFDYACWILGCTGRDLEDSLEVSPQSFLQVRESFFIGGLGGSARFTYADNVFLAPEPGTALLLLTGLAGVAGAQARRRSRSSK